MKFIIPGEPISKQRHRTSKGRIYDPQEKDKKAIQMELIRQVAVASNSINKSILGQLNALCDTYSFKVTFEFHIKTPKSDLWGLKIDFTSKKDLDNLCKMYLDCANGILYSDDHLVVEIHAKKCYNPVVKTIMDIEPMQIETETELSNEQKQALKMFSPKELSDFLEDISTFNDFSHADLDVMMDCEYQDWIIAVANKKIGFARKWGSKLNKLAIKTKDI